MNGDILWYIGLIRLRKFREFEALKYMEKYIEKADGNVIESFE